MTKKQLVMANISNDKVIVIPYSCGCLVSYAFQDESLKNNWNIYKIFYHAIDGVQSLVDEINEPIDLCALTLYFWNMNKSMKFARLLKEKFPNVVVAIGGPNAPDDSTNFFKNHPYVDLVAHKEGERTFTEILRTITNNESSFYHIPGLTIKDENNNGVRTKPVSKLLDLSGAPSPYLLGYFDEILEDIKNRKLLSFAIWETNRGCPYSCTFCDWGTMQKVRKFDDNKLYDEIEWMGNNINEVWITDANFGILPRDIDITKAFIKEKEKEKLRAIHITYAKNANNRVIEIAKLLSKNHLSELGATIALQSNNDETLKLVKRNNINKENYYGLVKKFKDEKIETYCDLIYGLPAETKETFFEVIDMVIDSGINYIGFHPLMFFENVEINNKISWKMFGFKGVQWKAVHSEFEDEIEYNTVVNSTKWMSDKDMIDVRRVSILISMFYFGKWTFYVSNYLNKTHAEKYTNFHNLLFQYFYQKNTNEKKNSVVNKIVFDEYLKKTNGNKSGKLAETNSPFEIEWCDITRRETFFWLCISNESKRFYDELREFVFQKYGYSEQLEDLIKFQEEIMINFHYDPKIGKSVLYKFNWHDYFFNEIPLVKQENTLIYHDTHVGLQKQPLIKENQKSFLSVAGGNDFYPHRFQSQIHQPETTTIQNK